MKLVVIEVGEEIDPMSFNFPESGQSVVGVFKVPTKFCDPYDPHRGKKTQAGWTRGQKYGWWVCGVCKKPTEAWGRNLNTLLSSTRNLLEGATGILGAAQIVRTPSTGSTSSDHRREDASSVDNASVAGSA